MQLINFISLDRSFKELVFYSEGKHNWPHFKGLIKQLIYKYDQNITVLSSDKNDPCFKFLHKNLKVFYVGSGHCRNWIFRNLEAKILISTTPDFETFQLKRSCHQVHYIYIQHSLISLHMGYRKDAFNHFDTIFCSGNHHLKEMKRIIDFYKLKNIKLFKHGYSRIEDLIKKYDKKKITKKNKSILIAPTWGNKGLIETKKIREVLDKLNNKNICFFIRPHPETWKKERKYIYNLVKNFDGTIKIDKSLDDDKALLVSDILISDWSGIAFEYAIALKKPVIFLDTEKKINNLDYNEINIEPFEIKVRDKIGKIVKITDLKNNINYYKPKKLKITDFIYPNADFVGAKELMRIKNNIKERL